VLPFLASQVDQLDGLSHAKNRGLDDGSRRPGDGHDGAVMCRIHSPIEQAHPLHIHRGHNGFDAPGIPAFREVWHALYDGPDHSASAPEQKQQRPEHFESSIERTLAID
jgi:hypothetical protein